MKKLTLLLVLFAFVAAGVSQAQLKGSGEVFYSTTFDWENPADEKGWTAPEDFIMIDPDDNGMNFHWYPNDSLDAKWVKEPPFRSTSREDGHLCLFLNWYNQDRDDARVSVNNSVQFPTFDCSAKSSVVIEFETSFMCNQSSGWEMLVEVSNDAGVHWAAFDCGYGLGHKERPEDIAPGGVALFQANISEVAAGMPEVVVRLTWRGTTLYFWLIDDFKLMEAWDNDLQMKDWQASWDNGDENTDESVSYMMPKSQLGGAFHKFGSVVLNFGELDQDEPYLEIDISKNNQSVFNATQNTTDSWLSPLLTDTVEVEGSYTPEDYGHYKVKYTWQQTEEEQTPENNTKEFFFNVTDSVYSRSDETMDMSWSPGFEWYTYGFGEDFWNIEHFAGSIFPIYGDCEVDGVSVFISGGLDEDSIDFRYSLFLELPEEEDVNGEGAIEWLMTEQVMYDSSMIGKWLYMPFDKDGESEFLMAGDIVYAGINYNNYMYDELDRRNYNIAIGSDNSSPTSGTRAIGRRGFGGSFETGGWIGRNLMCKLIINNHGNIIDNVDLTTAESSLSQNYPNPFSHSTEIGYELGAAQDVTIEITDMTGRIVRVMDEGHRPAGTHTASFNNIDLEVGIYFYTLKAGQFKETKRMIVSR
ncbi:MAG: T9SS type A sorting domain-containing protein [Bacteroidetes bacterium]|nr:T9SS type A sorting domain-containing protein [Bacteroidota bacterium]MBT4409158.1 T9SS type A sorting domain-containing protein [Bacteroidota bacterium]